MNGRGLCRTARLLVDQPGECAAGGDEERARGSERFPNRRKAILVRIGDREDGDAVVEGDGAGTDPLAHLAREERAGLLVDRDRAQRDEAQIPLACDQPCEPGFVDPALPEDDLTEALAALLAFDDGLLELFRGGHAFLDHQ